MRLIIAGSRDLFCTPQQIQQHIEKQNWPVSEVVSGCARGVDLCGERWANEHNIPVKRFPADWQKFGKAAGPIRNRQMAQYADMALLVCASEQLTPGTQNMHNEMQKLKKQVVLLHLAE